MTMIKVEIDVPEAIVPYTVLDDKEAQITRNAMLSYQKRKDLKLVHLELQRDIADNVLEKAQLD